MCAVPPVVVDHANVVQPQFNDVFGCQIEMNDEQNNEQYNEHVDDLENIDEEPAQIQTHGRRVQRVSYTTPDMCGTSEVRRNVTTSDSDNATT